VTPARHTLDVVEVPLPGGRLLRLGIYRTPDGEPHTLHLAVAWPDASPWRPGTPGECLILPATILPALRTALAELDGEA
jgi:hypothetical protein